MHSVVCQLLQIWQYWCGMLSNHLEDSGVIPAYPVWVLTTCAADPACLHLQGPLANLFGLSFQRRAWGQSAGQKRKELVHRNWLTYSSVSYSGGFLLWKKKKKKNQNSIPIVCLEQNLVCVREYRVLDISILLLLALNCTPEIELQVSSDSNQVKYSCFSDFSEVCVVW